VRSSACGEKGALLRVDLTHATHSTESVEAYVDDYVGGRGVGTKILWDELPPGTDPLGPDSILIFNNGPLSGTAAPASGRLDVSAKSPLNNFHAVTNLGGYWGVELRHAGYLHLLITGAREEPGYLWIHNDRVEVRDASHLWGLDTYETTVQLRRELGDEDTQVLSIGPAGENLVLFSNIVTNMGEAAGRFGIGAVMGSKKLKAIAVRGTRGVALAQPRRFLELARDAHRRLWESPGFKERMKQPGYAGMFGDKFASSAAFGNYEDGYWERFAHLEVEEFFSKRLVRSAGCHACFLQCKSLVHIPTIGYGLSGCTAFSSFVGTVWNEDLTTMWEAIILANRYGLDFLQTAGTIALLMELYEKGIITPAQTDGIPMIKGSRDAILGIIHKIGRREGVGSILADGIRGAAEALDSRAPEYVVEVKGLFPHGYAFPALEGASLMQAVGVGDPFPTYGTSTEQAVSVPGPWKNLLTEAKELFGSDEAYLPGNYSPAKVRMVIASEHGTRVPDMLGVCIKPYKVAEPFPLEDLVALYEAATGRALTSAQLYSAAERLVNLERLFDAREGLTREDDRLPQRFFKPIAGGVHQGKALDAEKMEEMKDVYYQTRGWDPQTGLPTQEKLRELGLEKLARVHSSRRRGRR
jgi:aldehyde:ferredoxin oxidoreductase